MIVPKLETRHLSVPPEPPEGAGREFTKLPQPAKQAAAEAIAHESAATGRKVDGKMIKSGIRKVKGKPEETEPTEPEKRVKSYGSHIEPTGSNAEQVLAPDKATAEGGNPPPPWTSKHAG